MKMRRDKEETPVKRLLIIQLEILQDSGGEGGGVEKDSSGDSWGILGGFLESTAQGGLWDNEALCRMIINDDFGMRSWWLMRLGTCSNRSAWDAAVGSQWA